MSGAPCACFKSKRILPMSMKKSWFTHFTCVLLLLFAQQVGVTHAVWHAGEHAPAHQKDDASFQAELCGLDGAFNQVLGGVQAAEVRHAIPLAVGGTVAHRDSTVVVPELHVPLSRGPPTLS